MQAWKVPLLNRIHLIKQMDLENRLVPSDYVKHP